MQTELLFPVVSNAITQRLRYLSFWSWCIQNTDSIPSNRRPLYEKIFLLANFAHTCDATNELAGNGLVGATMSLPDDSGMDVASFYTREKESIGISSADFVLSSSDSCGFDTYYRSVMERLLLIKDSSTITPLGSQLAEGFDAAVDLDFDAVETAVADETVPQSVLQSLSAQGCACSISQREKELLTKAYLGFVRRTSDYSKLAFLDSADDSLDAIYAPEEKSAYGGSPEMVDVKLWTGESDNDIDDVLEEYFGRGLNRKMRASFGLLLQGSDWVSRSADPESVNFGPLSNIRELWRLLIHSEWFIYGTEALLIAFLRTIRAREPVEYDQLLNEIITSEEYRRTVSRALSGVELEYEEEPPNMLEEVRNVAYFGDWFESRISPSLTNDNAEFRGTWGDLIAEVDTVINPDDFELIGLSERTLRELISRQLRNSNGDFEVGAQIFGLVTVLYALLASRYQNWFTSDEFDSHLKWYKTLDTQPSPSVLWNQEKDVEVGELLQSFATTWLLDHYVDVLYRKLSDRPSQSPFHYTLASDGTLTYDRMYAGPNISDLKFRRATDILYELDLTTSPSTAEFKPTNHGRRILDQLKKGYS